MTIKEFLAANEKITVKGLKKLMPNEIIEMWNELSSTVSNNEFPHIYKNESRELEEQYENITNFIEAIASGQWYYFDTWFWKSGWRGDTCISFSSWQSKKCPIDFNKFVEKLIELKHPKKN
jgi:uncharacterized protein YchJ